MTAAMMEEEGRWRGRRRGPRRVGLRQNKGWPPRATAAVMQATMAATMSEDGSYGGDGSGSSGDDEDSDGDAMSISAIFECIFSSSVRGGL